jgi:hypothetical protein
MNGDQSPLFPRALGYCLADFVSCCPYCSGRTYELVRTFAPPQAVEQFLKTRDEVMLGPDCQMLDELDVPKNEKFSLYWGGRFTATKGGEKSVRQYLQLMMGGRDVDVYVTVVGGGRRLEPVLKQYGASQSIHVMREVPYDQAMSVMKRCHAAVFYQLNPGAAAPYEWMYSDVITLFKRHGFAEELEMYPPGYPFLFEKEEECAAMLRWIYEDYEGAKKAFDDVGTKEWIREHCDKRLGCERIVSIAEDRSRRQLERFGVKPNDMLDTRELIGRTLQELDPPVPLPLLLKAMERLSGRQIVRWNQGSTNGIWPVWVHRSLIPEDWVDNCETEWPQYVPRSQVTPAAELVEAVV